MKIDRESLRAGGVEAAAREWLIAKTMAPAIGVVSFAALTAVGARYAIHIGPVPYTLQVFFVLLAGMVLGPKLGAASQLAYVAAGFSGIPVFSSPPYAGGGYLLGPTGGYLVGFVAAAWLTGWVVHRWRDARDGDLMVIGYAFAGMLGLVAIYAFGASGLAIWMLGGGKGFADAVSAAWKLGIAPFIVVDILKSAAAALSCSGVNATRSA